MSAQVTKDNLDEIIRLNQCIYSEIIEKQKFILKEYDQGEIKAEEKLAMNLLEQAGLIQIPLLNDHFGGAIYTKGGKKIPVLNTAQPRVYQYFVAWHEVYHLIFDDLDQSTHQISIDMENGERKADYFAAIMMLGNVYHYYMQLRDTDFMTRICKCIDTYKAPYKAILIQLYEEAMNTGNQDLMELIKNNFDCKPNNLIERFEELGLDASLVKPSYVCNVNYLREKIEEQKAQFPEVSYHTTNELFCKEQLDKVRHIVKGYKE